MPIRLNLDCGGVRRPDYLGVDRFVLPTVQVVADLNAPHLPFTTGSVDAVYASHSLEHVSDLTRVMKEVWRVCKPGAPVTLLAPYFTQGLNFANPYHKQAFNEHTPRFWTADPWGAIDRAEYRHPHAPQWGLSRSDNSDPGFDLRCRRMEFFYFPEYADLSCEEQQAARKKYLDVCDQILYHLLAFKPPMTEEDLASFPLDLYAPPVVAVRRRPPAPAPQLPAPAPPAGLLRNSALYRPLSWLAWKVKRRRVLVVYDSWTVSTFLYYEHVLPLLKEATGRQWLLRRADEVDPGVLYSFRTVILQRAISERSLAILQAARRSGCRTIYDADDNLLLIDQLVDDPANDWRRVFGAARPRIQALLAGASLVKLYSESARPLFARHNPRLAVVRPYQIVTAECQPAPRGEGPLTVGFLGSAYKDAEFQTLLPALEGLLAAGLLRLEFFGFVPESLRGREGVTVLPWQTSYLDFRNQLDAAGWHIGLAPLRDNDFNRCKSNNRFREYAASSIAGIYSDAEIYRTTVAGGETGLVVPHGDREAWSAAILGLAQDDARRETLIRNAHADVRANYRAEDYVAGVAALV